MYSIVRLIIIALMITYFIGCIFYYISNEVSPLFIEIKNKANAAENLDGRLLSTAVELDKIEAGLLNVSKNITAIREEIVIEEEALGGTFVRVNFQEGVDDEYKRIVLMLYFALTTLSTVGYGDYHPISDLEMIITSLVMLGGVAFFSYIMGNFIEIITNYDAKMGTLDKSDELNTWITSLERFTNKTKTNLSVSLVNQIISN